MQACRVFAKSSNNLKSYVTRAEFMMSFISDVYSLNGKMLAVQDTGPGLHLKLVMEFYLKVR